MIEEIDGFEKDILKFISKRLSSNDLLHTLGVVKCAKEIAKRDNLSKKESEILIFAAYFHDYKKRDGSIKEHHLTSAKIAKKYLKEKKYPYFLEVEEVIKTHSYPIKQFHDKNIEHPKPKNLLQLLLIKADMIEQIEVRGISRMFVKNLEKGLSFEDNLKDINKSVNEAKEILEWVEGMIKNEE